MWSVVLAVYVAMAVSVVMAVCVVMAACVAGREHGWCPASWRTAAGGIARGRELTGLCADNVQERHAGKMVQ